MTAAKGRRPAGPSRVGRLGLLLAAGLLAACSGTASEGPTVTAAGGQPADTGARPRADSTTPNAAGMPTSAILPTGQGTPSSAAGAQSGGIPAVPPAHRPGTLTLAFGGDIHFEGRVAALLTRPDGLADVRPLLETADVAVVNLESAITDRGSPEAKIYHFRTSPRALSLLADAGVDVVSMANNHSVDFGPDGLTDTLAAQAASPVPVVGIGRNAAQAFAPAVLERQGLRIAVIASTQVNDLTVTKYPATDTQPGVAGNLRNDRLLAAVAAARAAADVVVVFLHWGTDYTTCPDSAQVATATALEKAGVDVVVGGHAHRVQGSGWLGRAYVGYGLGNFVWLNTRGEADTRSGVLTVSVDVAAVRARAGMPRNQWATVPSVVVAGDYTPLRVADADGVPRPPADAAALSQGGEQARGCARLRGSRCARPDTRAPRTRSSRWPHSGSASARQAVSASHDPDRIHRWLTAERTIPLTLGSDDDGHRSPDKGERP